jgi:hypothetical protein
VKIDRGLEPAPSSRERSTCGPPHWVYTIDQQVSQPKLVLQAGSQAERAEPIGDASRQWASLVCADGRLSAYDRELNDSETPGEPSVNSPDCPVGESAPPLARSQVCTGAQVGVSLLSQFHSVLCSTCLFTLWPPLGGPPLESTDGIWHERASSATRKKVDQRSSSVQHRKTRSGVNNRTPRRLGSTGRRFSLGGVPS